MEQAELAAIHARAEAELTRIPGVLGVGFGRKEVDGKVTDQVSLRVYVAEKKSPAELAPEEMVPDSFEGIPTDVLVVREIKRVPCEDQDTHSPLIGGISITDFHGSGGSSGRGTLGFFATLNGVAGPENVVLITNHHVLASAAVGDTVYHPQWMTPSGGGPRAMVTNTGPIAKVHALPAEADHNFTYPGEAAADYFVDCASAKLDICISSWCNTNCGVSYKNEIRDLNIGGNSRIESVARVAQSDLNAPGDYVVYKVGARTSKTTGHVIDIAAVISGGNRLIEIDAAAPDCDGIDRFAAEGDSGSAVINAQNQLVGLLFAVSASDASRAFACHIHPVMDRLAITPISAANPPVGPAGQARADVRGFIDGLNETIPLRERFLATPQGTEVYAAVLAHRAEVVALVNHRRPVTVAWHRAQGPAFLAHGVENARNPGHRVPREIDSVDRETLARRMAEILTLHGSAELKDAMAQWLPVVLAHIDDFDSLHDLVGRFEPESADA